MIYKTPKEVLLALFDGKILKSTYKIYKVFIDKHEYVYIRATELGYIEQYDLEYKYWLKSSQNICHVGYEWEDSTIPTPTITVNGVEIPEPVREAPDKGISYYVLDFRYDSIHSYVWDDTKTDNYFLEHGYVHLTREGAEKQLEILKTIFKQQ